MPYVSLFAWRYAQYLLEYLDLLLLSWAAYLHSRSEEYACFAFFFTFWRIWSKSSTTSSVEVIVALFSWLEDDDDKI